MTLTKRHALSLTAGALLGLALPLTLQAQPTPETQAHKMRRRGKHPHGEGTMHERGTAPQDAPRFSAQQAMAARSYFEEEGHQGYVSPQRTRPGQAASVGMRHWQLGQALEADTLAFPLPRPLILAMGTAPAGYRYARVDDDILLVDASSGVVVDVIENVAR